MKRVLKIVLPIVLCVAILLPIFSCIAPTGTFYSLEKAYANGLLTESDLTEIADHYNLMQNKDEQNFLKQKLSPSVLSKRTIRKITRTYKVEILKKRWISSSYIYFDLYYGTYNGALVIDIIDNYILRDVYVIDEVMIGGVMFYNYSPTWIRVWVE